MAWCGVRLQGSRELGLYERSDLQRLLRGQPTALGEDLLIVGEEFGDWEDSRRRIDLLAVDRDAHLVVIELKRTDDGGHMELQALRYAAMVSSMTFDEIAAAYGRYRAGHSQAAESTDARAELAEFIGFADDADSAVVSADVRIVLVSANFGREITTAVLWLNRFDGMDIRCVRMVPYEIGGSVFLDIQQVIPLPEAADYQVRLRKKDAARERSSDGRDFTRYHIIVNGRELPDQNKRNAVRVMVTELGRAGVPYPEIEAVLSSRAFRSVAGQLTDGDRVRNALSENYPAIDLGRWFTDRPLLDENGQRTYVLFKMWGRNTQETLERLATAFPAAKVTFRAAD